MSLSTHQRLENMIRIGTIETVQTARPFATVTVNLGEITTAPLRFLSLRAGHDTTWDAPSIGEEVVVLSPSGVLEMGIVVAGLHNAINPIFSTDPNEKLRVFEDGCMIAYDVKKHSLKAVLPAGGKASLVATGGITIEGDTTIIGNVIIQGTTHSTQNISTDQNIVAAQNITATGGMSASGNIESSGEMKAQGDVTAAAGAVSLLSHKHGLVEPGDGESGEPL